MENAHITKQNGGYRELVILGGSFLSKSADATRGPSNCCCRLFFLLCFLEVGHLPGGWEGVWRSMVTEGDVDTQIYFNATTPNNNSSLILLICDVI